MTTEKKEIRGGARPNSGVKADPLVGKRIKVSTTLIPNHFELIEKAGKPMSQIIETALNLYFNSSSRNEIEPENKIEK